MNRVTHYGQWFTIAVFVYLVAFDALQAVGDFSLTRRFGWLYLFGFVCVDIFTAWAIWRWVPAGQVLGLSILAMHFLILWPPPTKVWSLMPMLTMASVLLMVSAFLWLCLPSVTRRFGERRQVKA